MTEPSSTRENVTSGFIVRSSGTWVQTPDGWFVSTSAIAEGGPIQDLFLFDHEGMNSRQVPPGAVISAEDVESEALYNGHWIPLVSTWRDGSTRIRAPLPSSESRHFAVLYVYSSPEWKALVSLPRAEVHDSRGGNGGVSFRVPLTEFDDYREIITPLFGASMASEQTIPASKDLSAVDEVGRLAPDVISVTRTDTAVVVQADEMTLRVTLAGRTWRVRKSWRSDDRGVAFEATDETDIARFLIAMFANDIRRARGLTPRRRAVTLSDEGLAQPAAWFTLSREPDAGFVLTDTYRRVRWRFASDLDAARFSWIAQLAWTDIRAEFGRSEEVP
ncbi:hypothetical protein CSIV_10645 [Microbacterium sp. CSI-V]|uniref:hypothetical protein n=1 Tax=unclassified Microbacterium TaxID=2609290 RepID=UPI00097C512A|nr:MULTISPECIES: hypothetical protein [unclassified Microbacterium]MXS76034.1 hypothetical protein [Microbacterium sp. TL13]ONI65128.1 hypothetical protein CSIV_10645 [Microbacterium sp. CSI-V]